MPSTLSIKRVVLYKHGVGYFERRGNVSGAETVLLDFKARDMNDVLKSMTVLDLGKGTVSAVGYDSTKPVAKLLEEATIRLPENGSLTALLGQIKGARIRAKAGSKAIEGAILGTETRMEASGEVAIAKAHLVLLEDGKVRTHDLSEITDIEFLDETVRKDVEFYLSTVLSSYKKDSKRVAIVTAGSGKRELFISYTIEAPVWKTSYRVLLDEGGKPTVQGWAVVDNTGDDDWEDVDLALISGLPISFIHDLYHPRYMNRPVVEVETEAAAAPVITEEAIPDAAPAASMAPMDDEMEEQGEYKADRARRAKAAPPAFKKASKMAERSDQPARPRPISAEEREQAMRRTSEVKTLVKEVGDLFEYKVANPVTVRRNQSALVPILHEKMEGKRVLLWNRATREKNPLACIELVNSSALTLEGGPLTVTEGDHYVGEAMLDTMKPGDRRFVPFAVELGCVISVDDTTDSGAVYKAVVAHGSLSAEYWQYRRTKLSIRNKGKRAQTLWVEHPKSEGWELDDTPKPAETTDRYYRFKVELSPGKDAELRISERAKGWHTWSLDSADEDTVKYWIESKYVDKRIVDAMKDVIALKAKIDALEEKKSKLDEEREKLFEDQERLRENVGAMKGGGASQKEAAEKWVKKLAAQEDRLEKIESESGKIDKEIEKLQEEVDERVQKLAFTADLGEKK